MLSKVLGGRIERHHDNRRIELLKRFGERVVFLHKVMRGKRARVKQKAVWQSLTFQDFKYIRLAVRIGDKEIKPRSIRIQFLLLPVHS